MKKRIFYSWQSDLPNNTNRGFINTALEKAIENIASDSKYSVIPFLDRDTMGLAGSPDISASIFGKIEESTVFVCDVSIINGKNETARYTPNPNVLIELGYAIAKIGWHSIILVMNEEYGKVEQLPFDLRGRKVLTYCISSESEQKAEERKRVSAILQSGIATILESLSEATTRVSEKFVGRVSRKLVDEEAKTAKEKLNAISSINNIRQRDDLAINETEKYLAANRIDLAVGFALIITNLRAKNDFLIGIARDAITKKDSSLANKAINGVTNVRIKSELSMELLQIIG